MLNLPKKITIYDKYIFSQIFMTTFVAILLFTVVWIAPEMLLHTIEKMLSGEYTVGTAIKVLLYELPKILGKAFPVGLLLGSLFTFDKLSKDSELTIFRAVGLSFKRILAPVLVFSVIVTGLCFITYDKLIPKSEVYLNKLKKKNPTTQYIYTEKDKKGTPKDYVIVSKFQNNKMERVIYLDFTPRMYDDFHGLKDIYYASYGYPRRNKWILRDVAHYKISEDGIFEEIEHLNRMPILRGQSAKNALTLMSYSTKREREITNSDLWAYVQLLKKEKIDDEYRLMMNKYLQRYFHPFVCILLAILGVILGFSKPREQRLIGFTIAIGCIFIYYITLPFFDLLAEKGVLPPLITAIFPLVAFAVAIVGIYKSKEI